MQPLAFFIFAEKYRCENGWSTTPRFISFPLQAFWSMIFWRKWPERKDEVHEFPVWKVHEAHSRSTAVGRNAPSRTQTIILQVIYCKDKSMHMLGDRRSTEKRPHTCPIPMSFEMWRTKLWRSCQNRSDLSTKEFPARGFSPSMLLYWTLSLFGNCLVFAPAVVYYVLSCLNMIYTCWLGTQKFSPLPRVAVLWRHHLQVVCIQVCIVGPNQAPIALGPVVVPVPCIYYRKRGSASYIVREVHSVRERDTERERERKTEVTSPLSR